MRPAAVIGSPVSGSASPEWHRRRLSGRLPAYGSVEAGPGLDRRGMRRLMAGLLAANVTAPHKGLALVAADVSSAAAWRCRAANLLWWRGTLLVADNTDLPAFARLLTRLAAPRGEWLVLGTGGAARAAAAALAARGDRPLLVSRDPDGRPGPAIGYREADERAPRAAGAVNATSVPDPPFASGRMSPDAMAVDYGYRGRGRFLAGAAEAGAATTDGWPLFVAQARLSARAWLA